MRRLLVAAATFGVVGEAAAQGGAPLSAIEWLSSSVESASVTMPVYAPPPIIDEPPIASDASTPGITVTPLDSTAPDAAGTIDPAQAGLPPTFWSSSDEDTLVALIRAEPVETLPALRDLLVTLMLVRAKPPVGSGPNGRMMLARVDKLLDIGALGPARALLEDGDLLDPESFRRWFDVTLLTGTEHDACAMLREHPSLAPTLMARVFCLARNGDWAAASLILNTARALGDIPAEEDALLARYLDSGLAEEDAEPLAPSRPSPLAFRMREAIGETPATIGLPLAFSHADLRSTVAWRAQIESAERLARNGALEDGVLLNLYLARAPAASGGVWDRAKVVQDLEGALEAGDPDEIAVTLEAAWALMDEVGLEAAFAGMYGERLASVPLTGEAAFLAFRVALLSPAYATAAAAHVPANPQEILWAAIATGDAPAFDGADAGSAAVIAGLADAAPPDELAAMIAEERTGEAALRAIDLFELGLDGDHGAVTDGIATMRALGLDDVARQAALQYLILDGSQ